MLPRHESYLLYAGSPPNEVPAALQGGTSAMVQADKSAIIAADESALRFDKLQGILAKANKAGKGVQDAF